MEIKKQGSENMKKVPILGDVEQGLDKTMKDLLGPFKVFYPALKLSLIASTPAVLAGYVGYRSIPYLIDGLRSRAAIDSYKKAGKLAGKGVGKLGNMAFKYTKKSVMSLGAVATKQAIKLKDYSLEKMAERKLNKENALENNLEELHYDNCVNLDINEELQAENGFNVIDNNLEQDFFTEPQLPMEETDYELNDDEIDMDCMNVSSDFAYRFTIDGSGNIKQYSVYKNNVCENPKDISREEYRNISSKFLEFQNNKENDNSRSYDVELS